MSGSDKFSRIKNQGNIILKSRLLQNLSKVECYEFLQLCHRRDYLKDEHIYYQGDPGTGMYFIEEGKVQLITRNEENEETFSHTIESPESFGVSSIGYEFRRFATAKCLTDCTLLGFFKPDFETLKKRQPHIAVKFMETLAMIAMRQLSTAIDELKDTSDAKRIIALQYGTYHDDEQKRIIF
ncbi:MAG: cyclic nucleotide-binding domain-containing protein [Balneolaceae bacterium]|nr:cyclic nucleotide-binding domain-containing protein [Balneolaceae bacterium]